MRNIQARVCNFPMTICDREIARELKFPDRESREIGKFKFTSFGAVIFAQRKTALANAELHGMQISLLGL